MLAAFSLRPAVVAVGPLAQAIQADTGLTPAAVSLLTTLPLVCFGAIAAVAAGVGGRLGVDRAIVLALALIVGGIGLRMLIPMPALFVGTVIAASGIALGNVLIPAAIKQYQPLRLGILMAAYSVALQSGATLAPALTIPLGEFFALDWRGALALWGVPAVVALVVWLPRIGRGGAGPRTDSFATGNLATGTPVRSAWGTRLGWMAGAFIGIQSGVYFAIAAWMPTLLQDSGVSAEAAGYLLSLVGLAGVVGGLPMPILATRMARPHSLVVLTTAAFVIGLLGLLALPATVPWVWAGLLGLGQGGGLALALTLFTLRARTALGAARLSGMAQTIGYLLAALFPLVVGIAYELTGAWDVPLILLLVSLVPLLLTGLYLSRPLFLEDRLPAGRSGSDAPRQ